MYSNSIYSLFLTKRRTFKEIQKLYHKSSFTRVYRYAREFFTHMETSPTAVKSYKSKPMLGTHCRAFNSGTVTNCFYDLGLSRLRFEHPTFRLRCQRSNPPPQYSYKIHQELNIYKCKSSHPLPLFQIFQKGRVGHIYMYEIIVL